MNRTDPQPPPTQEASVLIIDDDHEIRGILQERLRIEGLDSMAAPSGELGLASFIDRIARGTPFQTLILDIRMKGISGIELLKLIRLIDQQSTILMISGLGDLNKAVLCLRHGADDYLSKPIKIWDLKARLATAQGRRKAITGREDGQKNKGLKWGTAFVPQVPEEFSSAWNQATSIPGDKKPVDSLSHGSGEGTHENPEPKPSLQNEEEIVKSPDSPLDPGVLKTGNEREGQKGRKGGSLDDSPEHGMGENRAMTARESGSLQSGPEKKAPREPSNPAPHPGDEADLRAVSPLDVFFFLVDQLERQEVGWAGHSQALSNFLSKAAALLMRDLDLEPVDLDALRLAGLIHNLGLIRAHGTLGRGFASPPPPASSEASSPPIAPRSLIEDLTLPARVLEGIIPLIQSSQKPAAERAQATLEQAGRFRRQLQEFGSILDQTSSTNNQAGQGEHQRKTETMGLFFELADLSFHKAQGPFSEEESTPLPSDPIFSGLEAYASKLGFPFQKVQEGLSRLLKS